jgi:uncharacterized membrane protein YhaH (DUF805 family)
MQIDWVYLFNSAHGRISREPFWIGFVVVLLAEYLGHWLAEHLQGAQLSAIVGLALNYPEFMLTIKRANDRDLPAWLIGLYFVGDSLLGFLDLVGLSAGNIFVVGSLIWSAYLLVLIADLGLRRGTVGPNRFGPDPLAGKV